MRNHEIVKKLIFYCEKIMKYCEEASNPSYEQFINDEKLIELCAFNLSQMGELSKHIDDDFAEANGTIPWKQLYGLRNRIVHDYEGVNLRLIWEIINDDLPVLLESLKKIN